MFTLDIHCHFFSQAFLDAARKPNSLRASLERRVDGQEHLVCPGNFDHPLTPDFYAAEQMLADMDKTGITMAAISSAHQPSPIGPMPRSTGTGRCPQ